MGRAPGSSQSGGSGGGRLANGVAAGGTGVAAIVGIANGVKGADGLAGGIRGDAKSALSSVHKGAELSKQKAREVSRQSKEDSRRITAEAGQRAGRVVENAKRAKDWLKPGPLPLSPTDQGYIAPTSDAGGAPGGLTGSPVEGPAVECGSIVHVDTLALGEQIAIAGTSFHLRYATDRVPGRRGDYQLLLPGKPGQSIEVSLAGRRGSAQITAAGFAFVWDGVDGDGRAVIGRARTHVVIDGRASAPDHFIGNFKPAYLGLGGWGLSNAHYFDVDEGRLYLGDGGSRPIKNVDHRDGLYRVRARDGSAIFVFNGLGYHLETLHGLTEARIERFEYDPQGHLARWSDGRDGTITVERGDAFVDLKTSNGHVTRLALDEEGRLTRVELPGTAPFTMAYDDRGLLTEFKKPTGQVSHFTYDKLGYLSRDEGSGGNSLLFAAIRNVAAPGSVGISVKTAEGRASTYTLSRTSDGHYRREHRESNGAVSSREQFSDGRRRVSQPGIEVSSVTGVDSGSVHVQIEGLSPFDASFERSPAGGPDFPASSTLRVTQPSGVSTTTYDRTKHEITVTSAMDRVSRVKIDDWGQPLVVQMPGQLPIEYSYDQHGRPSTERSGSRRTDYAYGANGALESVQITGLGQVKLDHDDAGRVTKVARADGGGVTYAYDAAGRVIAITPSGRTEHTFGFNPLELVAKYLSPLLKGVESAETRLAYDHDRQLTEIVYPGRSRVAFSYGAKTGRLNGIGIGRGRYGLEYDSSGRISQITSPDRIRLKRDYFGPLPRHEIITFDKGAQSTVTYAYDQSLHLSSIGVGDVAARFEYDRDGVLTQAGEEVLNVSADSGRVDGARVGKVDQTVTRDANGAVTAHQVRFGSAVVFAEEFVRDELGRVTSRRDISPAGEHSDRYGYDPVGRLNSVVRDGSPSSSYAYDQNGNRVQASVGPEHARATFDAQDRLLTHGSQSFEYDARGRLKSRRDGSRLTTYVYDDLNQLIEVRLPSGRRIEYRIDGDNRRATRLIDGRVRQRYVYSSPLNLAATLNERGEVDQFFVYGMKSNVPDYFVDRGRTYRIVSDELGSPRVILDAQNGEVHQELDYDEFGRVTRDTNPGFQPFGFAGGLYDPETGLVRFGARDYDASVGRWTAKDPLLFGGGDTNLYGYVHGDPVNRIDPSGLIAPLVWAYVISIGLGAITAGRSAYVRHENGWAIFKAAAAGGVAGGITMAAGLYTSGLAATMGAGALTASMGSNALVGMFGSTGEQLWRSNSFSSLAVARAGVIGALSGGIGSFFGSTAFLNTKVIGNPVGIEAAVKAEHIVDASTGGVAERLLDWAADKLCELF